MELKQFKEGIITVYETELGSKVVLSSQLHEALQINERYSDWLKRKFRDHNLVEGKDYAIASDKTVSIKNHKRGGHNRREYVIKLHQAKKIALGTNNAVGDRIKDFFIRCEELVSSVALSLPDYTVTTTQKQLTKQVGGVLFSNGDPNDIIQHHQNNYKLHLGTTPSEYRKKLVDQGYKVKSKSGRDLARQFKPESACSMAMHDEFVSKGHSLEHLKEIRLREKLEPAFAALLQLGFKPKELDSEKNLPSL